MKQALISNDDMTKHKAKDHENDGESKRNIHRKKWADQCC